MAVGDLVTVDVRALAPGGDAVGAQVGGAAAGRATFVALAAPGERVTARLVREKARVAWGELERVEQPSVARVRPPCELFGVCGGCQWQHVEGEAQRAAKGEFVARALGTPVPAAKAVGPEYGYRERARLVVAGSGAAIGFHARRSHEVVDVSRCLLLAPALAEALPVVRELARGARPGATIALQAGREGRVGAEIEGRVFRIEPGRAPLEVAAGDRSAWIDVAAEGERSLLIPAGPFAQVGTAANAALGKAVKDAVGSAPGRTLELYAGSGNFTRILVAVASSVVATDGDAAAMDRGRRNVPEADWRPARSLDETRSFDTVVADPPRDGMDELNLGLAARALRRLVYVSCDPQTLARDGRRLIAAGFRLERALAFDLMPQTYHVEVVATFVRG